MPELADMLNFAVAAAFVYGIVLVIAGPLFHRFIGR